MEIVNKKEDSIRFGDVYIGDVFKRGNNYYLRVLNITCTGTVYNAANIKSGELTHFEGNDAVINVPGAFHAE